MKFYIRHNLIIWGIGTSQKWLEEIKSNWRSHQKKLPLVQGAALENNFRGTFFHREDSTCVINSDRINFHEKRKKWLNLFVSQRRATEIDGKMVDHKFPDEPVASITILIKLSNQFDWDPRVWRKITSFVDSDASLFVGYFWKLTKLTVGREELIQVMFESAEKEPQRYPSATQKNFI